METRAIPTTSTLASTPKTISHADWNTEPQHADERAGTSDPLRSDGLLARLRLSLVWSNGVAVAILTEDMKRLVREQGLGFYATVSEDGSPNLSPKGTTLVWDDDHLFFADIRSPQTIENIRRGSLVEINVVDPFVRKGYRFKGPAVIHEPGTDGFADGLARLRRKGSTLVDRVKAIVVIHVREARSLVSPAYDDGMTSEADMVRTFEARFARLHERFRDP